ncbi:hypothetical protein K458DRAFT_67548 [Lentithecium fluviatile CBS 122367]|uniref:Tachykinin family protein n=1 Tax=Lentithecium fluviatile CBS 122367 TaxID=1168545 RepID=A0A6G1JKN5_9PLEO|nr:hypothetical protein K458DRAFT_67548 [Lentithecium fluviatile CBS 122367]
MAGKVQFINSTGDFSSAAKKAQKSLVRSHIATQRQHQRRQRDVENHARGTRVVSSEQSTPPTAALNNTAKETPPESDGEETADEGMNPAGNALERYTSPLVAVSNEMVEQISSTEAEGNSNNDVLRPFHEGGHLLPLPTAPSPYSYLGQGTREWFVPMPLVKSHRMSKHLFYYVNVLMPKLHPSYTTNLVRRTYGCGMLRYADELTLASIAAFSATSRALISGDMEGAQSPTSSSAFHDGAFDWIHYKGQTIRLLNERLASGESVDVTDTGLVTGIVSLIFMEALTGNVTEATTHMNGLRCIATLWRTQPHKPMPYKVASKIVASDIKLATLTNTSPSLPFAITFDVPIPQPLPGISHLLPTLGTRLLQQWAAISTNAAFIPIIHDIVTMTRYTEAVYDWVFPYIEDDSYMEYIGHQNLWIEHRLLSFHTNGVIDEACRIACHLYVNTVLVRGWSNNSAVIRRLVGRLREVLSKGSFEREGLGDMLLWVSFIGACCSHEREDEGSFSTEFEKGVVSLGLESCEAASGLLSRFLFIERVHGEGLKRVWQVAIR